MRRRLRGATVCNRTRQQTMSRIKEYDRKRLLPVGSSECGRRRASFSLLELQIKLRQLTSWLLNPRWLSSFRHNHPDFKSPMLNTSNNICCVALRSGEKVRICAPGWILHAAVIVYETNLFTKENTQNIGLKMEENAKNTKRHSGKMDTEQQVQCP